MSTVPKKRTASEVEAPVIDVSRDNTVQSSTDISSTEGEPASKRLATESNVSSDSGSSTAVLSNVSQMAHELAEKAANISHTAMEKGAHVMEVAKEKSAEVLAMAKEKLDLHGMSSGTTDTSKNNTNIEGDIQPPQHSLSDKAQQIAEKAVESGKVLLASGMQHAESALAKGKEVMGEIKERATTILAEHQQGNGGSASATLHEIAEKLDAAKDAVKDKLVSSSGKEENVEMRDIASQQHESDTTIRNVEGKGDSGNVSKEVSSDIGKEGSGVGDKVMDSSVSGKQDELAVEQPTGGRKLKGRKKAGGRC